MTIYKLLLFLISYMPLYIMLFLYKVIQRTSQMKGNILAKVKLGISLVPHMGVIWWVLIVMILAPPILFLILCHNKIKRGSGSANPVKEIGTTSDSIVGYLMTYIVPFSSMNKSMSSAALAVNGFLFLTIMILFIRLNIVYLNPPLVLIGFNIFVEKNGHNHYLTRNNIDDLNTLRQAGQRIKRYKLTPGFYFLPKLDLKS